MTYQDILKASRWMALCGAAALLTTPAILADDPKPQNDAKTAPIEEFQEGVADIAAEGDEVRRQEGKPTGSEESLANKTQDPQGKKLYFPSLGRRLRAIEGVEKVNHVDAVSGMKCIFAFFEDKAAAKRWYYSDLHQGILDRFHPNRLRDREPMFKVPEDVGPMMGLACFTPPKGPGEPITQIAIELYQPLHGGFSRGGRFSPDDWKDTFEHYDQYYETESKKISDVDEATDKAMDAAEGAVDKAMDAAEGAVDKATDKAMDAAEGAVDKATDKALNAADKATDKALNAADKATDAADDAVDKAVDKVKDGSDSN